MSRKRQTKRRIKSLMWMIALTGMLLVSSTYAWFSTNRAVLLDNITAKVTAAEGLQISLDGENWGSTIDFSVADGQTIPTSLSSLTEGENNYNWPSELHPVSTGGTVAENATDLTFYEGELTNDGANLDNTEANTTYFIAFDLYFKNSSSQEADYLQLNTTSNITVKTANTGLENSVRVGLLVYEKTAGVTEVPATVRELSAGTPRVTIWEPNSSAHISEVSTNDARVKANTNFRTLGLIADPEDGIINVSSITKETFLLEQHTLQTTTGAPAAATYMPLTTATTSEAVTTLTQGDNTKASSDTNYMTLKGNAISKARVYIWLEGQDPDCIDTASTGQSLSIDLGFVKPSTSTTGK